jgi:cysteine-rich repeat protein
MLPRMRSGTYWVGGWLLGAALFGCSGDDSGSSTGPGSSGGGGTDAGVAMNGGNPGTGGRAAGGGSSSTGGRSNGGTGGQSTGGVAATGGGGGMAGAGAMAGAGGSPSTGGTSGTGGAGVVANRDGIWLGTTSQGHVIRIRIVSGEVDFMSVGYTASGCGSPISGIKNGPVTTVTMNQLGTLGGHVNGFPPFDITGRLDATSGSGELAMDLLIGDCTDSFTVTWTATRVSDPPVCTNGVVEWPEACDDGDKVDGDGCTSACALDGTPEEEPNDDGFVAVGENDHSWRYSEVDNADARTMSASLAMLGDEDGFRVFSTSSTNPVTVRIETFGRDGPGTCDVDTVLTLRDRADQVIATDDDSGPGACSSITYVLPVAFPATVVYANVADKGDDDTIGLYFLRISYP